MQSSQCQKYTYGIVGGIFPDPTDSSSSLIISSPNMTTLPNPLVHTQRVIRVLTDGKWGVDDATLHPQVFRNSTGHLPLIFAPQAGSPGSTQGIRHAELRHQDWFPKYADSTFGTIDNRLVSTLEAEANTVIKRFEDTLRAAELANADTVSSLSTRKPALRAFKNALNRLSIPGARNDCVWIWSSVQRILLDLLAFLDWHDTFRHLFTDPPDYPLPVDSSRLGAITSSHESAEILFKAGLPTYFIRRLGEVNVDTDIKHLLSDDVMRAVLSSTVIVAPGSQVGTPSAIIVLKPSRAANSVVIFRGEAKSPHRLSAMTSWLRRDHPLQHPQNEWLPTQIAQLKEFGIYDPSQHLLPSQTSPVAPVPIPTASTSHARTSATVSAASGSYSHKSQKSTKPTTNAQAASSKWLNRSKYLTTPLEPWMDAAAEIGRGHNDSTAPTWPGAENSKSDWRGYAFPDAGMVANMSNTRMRDGALCSYVHNHPVLVYRIQTAPADCALRNSVWRANLVACTLGASSEGSKNGIARKKAEDELNRSIKDAGFEGSISLGALPSHVLWHGIYIDTSKPLSLSVTRSILADMNEVEWRWEVVNLDAKLYDTSRLPDDTNPSSSSGPTGNTNFELVDSVSPSLRYSEEQRRLEVLQSITHFDGRYVPHESFYKTNQGFAARRNSDRATALLQLATLMDQWKGKWRIGGDVLRQVKGLTLMQHDELNRDEMSNVVTQAERRIARHYVSSFKDVFSRAPTLPRDTKVGAVV
ncbi:hypothetical protein CYLTODRAFT_416840, partial [Cylindrobasidium torrendii FP15055 ss-10]